jgi:AcrR family transcriptional regulator
MSPRRQGPADDPALEGLHPGRDGLPHPGTGGREPPFGDTQGAHGRQVAEIQRARMLAAIVDVVAERGAGNVTVARVVARSGVSRRTFYELFSDRDDCFLAAFDDAITRFANEVIPAYEQPAIWREKIRAGLCALLQVLDYDPGMGRLVIVETLGAGAKALERRSRVLAQVITAVDEGRREAKRSDGPPPLTAEGVAGGVLSVLHARLLEGNPGRLIACPRMGELAGPLMGMIVLPYLGPAAARKELDRPVPKAPARPRPVNSDPLRELEMRLTYRTVRVLLAVGTLGGRGSYPSNRAVGDAAGISDQGQISKLLKRLRRLGLIENKGAGAARGEPNAWTLTERGREVHGAISAQTSRS